jgi:hypothetical protein
MRALRTRANHTSRCRIEAEQRRWEAAASPAMSAMPPKAEVSSEHWRLRDGLLWVDGAAVDVIQATEPEPRIMRYELSDFKKQTSRKYEE